MRERTYNQRVSEQQSSINHSHKDGDDDTDVDDETSSGGWVSVGGTKRYVRHRRHCTTRAAAPILHHWQARYKTRHHALPTHRLCRGEKRAASLTVMPNFWQSCSTYSASAAFASVAANCMKHCWALVVAQVYAIQS
jgi:hypothetical protein